MMNLLTDDEVIRTLRLDVSRAQPKEALRNLRRLRRLGFVRIGKRILYREEDVERFVRENSVEAR